MTPAFKWALGALALVGAGMFKRRQSQTQVTLTDAPLGSVQVLNRERAAGVDARLQGFLDQWSRNGPFPLMVTPGGGVRTDAAQQAAYYAAGTSNAATLDQTPHGRGGAIDVARVQDDGSIDWANKDDFNTIGEFAEALGFTWGGRFPFYDGGHIQVSDWRDLPYPPGVA